MSTVDQLEALVSQERHLTPLESKYWCNQYKQKMFELALQVDMLRNQIYQMQYAKIEVIPEAKPVETPTLSKYEQTSIRMKAYWAARKKK